MPQSSPLNISLVGPSGAGKGTHAAALCSRFHFQHVATGDLFRDNVLNRTALGILARRYMDEGELVPDDIVDAMIEEWCDRLPAERGILFDGFPRTLAQAKFIESLLARLGRRLDAMVHLRVSDDEIVRRLSGRFICRSCQEPYHLQTKPPQVYGVCDECGGELYHRPDDSSGLIHARLRAFHRATEPLIAHYATENKLVVVSGEDAMLDVENELIAALEAVRNRTYVFTSHERATPVRGSATVPTRPGREIGTDLVLIGPPGSGKGTQAARLSAALAIPHISTGAIFRENLKAKTSLGQAAQTYMDRGELVPDDVTDAMVENRLSAADVGRGFILDGFPRNVAQAHALTDILERAGRRLSAVLYVKASDDVLIMRLTGRFICRQCQAPYHAMFNAPRRPGICDQCGGELYQRTDDSLETLQSRLNVFHRQTEPVIAFYRDAGLLREVDGEDDIETITNRLLSTIRRIAPYSQVADFASTR